MEVVVAVVVEVESNLLLVPVAVAVVEVESNLVVVAVVAVVLLDKHLP